MRTVPDFRFYPRVGSRYQRSRFGKRILLVGESHYGQNGSWKAEYTGRRLTRWAVKYNCKNVNSIFGRTALLFKEQPSLEFWNEVAFYNFVQFLVPTSKHRPSKEMFQQSREPFLELLEQIQPDGVLSLGKTQWIEMPWDQYEACPVKFYDGDGNRIDTGYYRLRSGKSCLATFIHHPTGSRRWSVARWTTVVEQFQAALSNDSRA
jgi:hypothetical protein